MVRLFRKLVLFFIGFFVLLRMFCLWIIRFIFLYSVLKLSSVKKCMLGELYYWYGKFLEIGM